MQVKKYEAPTLQEALDSIKKELGPEAIILQTKSYKKGFGLMSKSSVEVTVAVSDKSLHKKKFVESRLPQNARENLHKMSAHKQSELTEDLIEKHYSKQANEIADQVSVKTRAPAVMTQAQVQSEAPSQAQRYVDIKDDSNSDVEIRRLEDELRQLKRMLQEMKAIQESDLMKSGVKSLSVAQGGLSTLALQEMFELLVIAGIEKRLSYEILKTIQFELDTPSDDLEEIFEKAAGVMLQKLSVKSTLTGPKDQKPQVLTLLGAPGSGKTSIVGKLASFASKQKQMKAGLIHFAFDTDAQFESLLTLAKVLNVPFRAVMNSEELQAAIIDFQALDLVIIDVAGFSYRDGEKCRNLKSVLEIYIFHHHGMRTLRHGGIQKTWKL